MNKVRICIFILTAIFTQLLPARAQFAQDSIIDGVVAVVGANMILKSDIETQYLQFRAQGNIAGSSTNVKCTILENMLFQKLIYNQAQVDSVVVTESMVDSELDRRMRYMISQVGSPDRLEEYFQKPSSRSRMICGV